MLSRIIRPSSERLLGSFGADQSFVCRMLTDGRGTRLSSGLGAAILAVGYDDGGALAVGYDDDGARA